MNESQLKRDRVLLLPEFATIQSAPDVGIPDALITQRHKAEVTMEEVIVRRDQLDCRGEDLIGRKIRTRAKRVTFAYEEVTPEIIAYWEAYYKGAQTGPTGTPADEVQRLTYAGAPDGGTFRITAELEGFEVTTRPIEWNATSTKIAQRLSEGRMIFIQPGDISIVGGTGQEITLVVAGTANATGDLDVTVVAAGDTELVAGKVIPVAITDTDTAAIVAGKIRAALLADPDVGDPVTGFFTVSGADENVILKAKLGAENDATMEMSYETELGMTGATSTITEPGVASTEWGENGMTITFINRLRKANIPTLTIVNDEMENGTVEVTAVTEGEQNFFEFQRSVEADKRRFSFVTGWESVTDRFDKYVGFAVDSITKTISNRQPVGLTVTAIGPWESEVLESFTVPPCVNIDPLFAEDCRLWMYGRWETVDINQITVTQNDNVPTDEASMFGFNSPEVQDIKRGINPSYSITGSVFAAEKDPIYERGLNERTESPGEIRVHYGMPGDRYTDIAENAMMAFQTNPMGYAGTLEKSVVNFEATPFRVGTTLPVSGEAYIDQTDAFLQTPA